MVYLNITDVQRRKYRSYADYDRDTQIHKYMREKKPGINYQFDVWYFVKNIKKKVNKCKSESIL